MDYSTHLPQRARPAYASAMKLCRSIAALALISIVGVGCATNPVTGKKDLVLMSEDQELEIGREHHKKVMH